MNKSPKSKNEKNYSIDEDLSYNKIIKKKEGSLTSLEKATPSHMEKKTSIILEDSDSSKMNFQKWVICLISIGILVMSPMVCYLGIEASAFGFQSIIADKALILISIFTFLVAIITIIGTVYSKINVLIFTIYTNSVLFVFILIFAIGSLSFSPDMQSWIYSNWDEIRKEVNKLNLEQFETNFNNSLISLSFFSFTISLGLCISITAILFWIPIKQFLASVLSSFALIFIVFSSASIMIAFQIKDTMHEFLKVTSGEEWLFNFSIANCFVLTFIGCLGYYASIKNNRKMLIVYLVCMFLTSALLLFAGITFILLAGRLEKEVNNRWDEISESLTRKGFHLPISMFISTMKNSCKFAGLFGLAFFIFNIVGITTSVYQLKKLRE